MDEKFYIGGKHAVLCAINNPNRIVHEIYLTNMDSNINFNKKKIVDKFFFNKIFKNSELNHQYIAALVSPLKNAILKNEINEKKLNKIIILNGISDQRNIGSIMRTVFALKFDGIILEKKFFNQKNTAMIKTSSGAIEYLKFFTVSNIKNEIKILKKEGFTIIGMDSNAKTDLISFKNFKKFALIFGSESDGIKNSVLKQCDEILKIEMNNKIKSLNVSNAVAATISAINILNKD